MTLKSRSALLTQANEDLPDNVLQLISPEDVRRICKDIVDSMVSKNGDSGILNILQYNGLFTFTDDKDIVNKKYVDDEIDALNFWDTSGNTLEASTFELGSLDNFDFKIIRNSIDQITFGASSIDFENEIKVYGTGNTGATFGQRWYDSDVALIASLDNNGVFSIADGIASVGDADLAIYLNGANRMNIKRTHAFSNYTTLELLSIADSGADSQNAIVFQKPSGNAGIISGYSSASDLAFLAADSGVAGFRMALKTQGMTLNGDIFDSSDINRFAKIDNRVLVNQSGVDIFTFTSQPYINSGFNFGFGGTDFQSGVGVQFWLNTTTEATGDPTGGVIVEVINGTVWHRLPTGEKVCVAGRQITDSDDYTQLVGDTTLIYTGTGGHTFTLHTAVGLKDTKLFILNRGSGNLNVNSGTLAAGSDLLLISDNTNWI